MNIYETGVAQECPFSLYIFHTYVEEIIHLALNMEEGIKLNGFSLNYIKYADDDMLIANNKDKLANLMNKLNSASKAYNLTMNSFFYSYDG